MALVLEVQAGDDQALAELFAAHLKLLDNVIGPAVTGALTATICCRRAAFK